MKRVILTIELLILCGPAFVMLLVGLVYSPVFVLAFFSESADWDIGAIMIFCGAWGFISLINLALHVLSKRDWLGHPVQWFGLLLGIVACGIGLSTMAKPNSMLWVFIGPIIAVVHLLYLSNKRTQK